MSLWPKAAKAATYNAIHEAAVANTPHEESPAEEQAPAFSDDQASAETQVSAETPAVTDEVKASEPPAKEEKEEAKPEDVKTSDSK